MRILAQYVAREFLKFVCLLVVSFVAIYTIFDFIEKVDNFQEAQVPASIMLSFFLLQVPEITVLMLPLTLLMATVLSLGLMSKRNEITALKSSGVSIFRFSLPILLLALAFTFASALINEGLLPQTKARTNYIWDILVEKRPGRLYHKEKFWYKGRNSMYRVGYYDPATQTLSNVVYYRFDKNFNLTMRVDASRLRYVQDRWIFFNGLKQTLLPGGGYAAAPFKEMELKLPETPQDLTRIVKPSEEMDFSELARYVRKIDAEGYDARRYRVDLQAKLSFPFVCLIMALWGIPLALFKEKGRSLAPGVVLGLGAALVYWVGFSYVRSIFGYSGVLPPLLAVWLPNGVFGLAGLWMLTSIRQ